MQSAGFTVTRSHPPIQNLAKAPKLRRQAEHPHFVYSLLAATFIYLQEDEIALFFHLYQFVNYKNYH